MEAILNPLSMLKREADSIRSVIKTIEDNILDLQSQITEVTLHKTSLTLIVGAIDTEMDRLRNAVHTAEQLEFELDPE